MTPTESGTPGTSPMVDDAVRRALTGHDEFVLAVLDSLAEGIVACDADGTLVLFNRATRVLHGMEESPLPPSEWADHYSLFHADGATPMTMEEVPLFRALHGETVEAVALVIAPRAGRARRVRSTGRQIRAEDGTLLGAVVAMHDVTEQLAAEERLAAEREAAVAEQQRQHHVERLEQLHAASLRLFSELRMDGLVQRLVGEVLVLTGASGSSATLGADGPTALLGVPGPAELRVPMGDGSLTIWGEEPWHAEDQALLHQLAAVGAAAVRSRHLTDQLTEERSHRMRDDLIAAISHDMQTPTSTLVGLASTLSDRSLELDRAQVLSITGAMQRQGQMLSALVGQFMDYCRLQAGHDLGVITAELDLAALVRTTLAPTLHTERVTTALTDGITLRGDANRLGRLVSNLVGNALKYSEGEVAVTLTTHAGAAELRVTDRGPGLGPDPERLFRKFARGGTADTDGTGLGLYVGRALAEAHGGTLTGATRPEGGAEFVLRLPLEPDR